MKILINVGVGGFSFSRKAYELLCAAEIWGTFPDTLATVKVGAPYDNSFTVDFDFNRSDPQVILIVEKIGLKESSGRHTKLAIVEIPDGVKKWEVIANEYGIEVVICGDYEYVYGTTQ